VIFVTIGTHEVPFDRLIGALAPLAGLDELIVQRGSSSLRPEGATCLDFLSFPDLYEHLRRARVVVTHAGAGSVIAALSAGKRPIVVPRLHRFGEAVDDHQLVFAHKLDEAGLVTCVEDIDALAEAVRRAEDVPVRRSTADRGLVEDLAAYIGGAVAERAAGEPVRASIG
jgi:beta-1,4-N-acetylglucosaminyltransferase